VPITLGLDLALAARASNPSLLTGRKGVITEAVAVCVIAFMI
jgi:hypothetical protein